MTLQKIVKVNPILRNNMIGYSQYVQKYNKMFFSYSQP
jgi:hypothetical protein